MLCNVCVCLFVDFLEPYKPRPQTNASVARNLVSNALGIRSQVPKEKRDEEKRQLKEAKGCLILYIKFKNSHV